MVSANASMTSTGTPASAASLTWVASRVFALYNEYLKHTPRLASSWTTRMQASASHSASTCVARMADKVRRQVTLPCSSNSTQSISFFHAWAHRNHNWDVTHAVKQPNEKIKSDSRPIPPGTLVLTPLCHFSSVIVTSACTRRATRVERRRGRRASRSGTCAASQAFEHIHNTLSHRVKT